MSTDTCGVVAIGNHAIIDSQSNMSVAIGEGVSIGELSPNTVAVGAGSSIPAERLRALPRWDVMPARKLRAALLSATTPRLHPRTSFRLGAPPDENHHERDRWRESDGRGECESAFRKSTGKHSFIVCWFCYWYWPSRLSQTALFIRTALRATTHWMCRVFAMFGLTIPIILLPGRAISMELRTFGTKPNAICGDLTASRRTAFFCSSRNANGASMAATIEYSLTS